MRNKIKTIVMSRFKKQGNENFVKERREICKDCPYNTKNTAKRTIKVKIYKHLSDFYTWLTRVENEDLGECGICGCNLYFLTNEPEDKCSAEPPKWESIYIPNQ